jgi:hypothetical protein
MTATDLLQARIDCSGRFEAMSIRYCRLFPERTDREIHVCGVLAVGGPGEEDGELCRETKNAASVTHQQIGPAIATSAPCQILTCSPEY